MTPPKPSSIPPNTEEREAMLALLPLPAAEAGSAGAQAPLPVRPVQQLREGRPPGAPSLEGRTPVAQLLAGTTIEEPRESFGTHHPDPQATPVEAVPLPVDARHSKVVDARHPTACISVSLWTPVPTPPTPPASWEALCWGGGAWFVLTLLRHGGAPAKRASGAPPG
jgi:hypothetical protein